MRLQPTGTQGKSRKPRVCPYAAGNVCLFVGTRNCELFWMIRCITEMGDWPVGLSFNGEEKSTVLRMISHSQNGTSSYLLYQMGRIPHSIGISLRYFLTLMNQLHFRI
jgi:hypothetical protein